MFEGGPLPIHPLVPPAGRRSVEGDVPWAVLVRCGGAGDGPDTAEQQRARYGGAQESVEVAPGLSVHALRHGPDLLAVCGLDYTIRTFNVREGYRAVQVFEGHTNGVNCVEPYRGTMLISASDDMTLRLWNLSDQPHAGPALTIWVSPAAVKAVCGLPGLRAACGGADKCVRVLSLVTGAVLHKLEGHRLEGPDAKYFQRQGCGSVWCLLHVRGNVLCSGSDDSTIRLWDADQGTCFGVYAGHPGYQGDVPEPCRELKLPKVYAPVCKICHLGGDGSCIASASYDRTITIWDVSDPRNAAALRTWSAGSNSILSVCAAAEGHLASCGADREVKVWDWTTGRLMHQVQTRGIPGAACLVDGSTLAIAGGDATIRIYNWTDGADLMGEHGFYAMDFCITGICGVFAGDSDPKLWTQQPILYQTVPAAVGEQDALAAMRAARQLLRDALQYKEID